MNSKIIFLKDKQMNDLKNFFKKIELSTEKASKEFNIEEVSSQISEKYEKTISPGQAEAVLRRVMGITLSSKERSQLYDLRKKIQRYEKLLTNFTEWGIKYDYLLKMIILGLAEEQSDYLPQVFNKLNIVPERAVIGVNFFTKLTENYDKTLTRLQIWDVTSSNRFATIRPQYYRGAAAAILVFNKENRDSFDMIKKYYNELNEITGLKFKLKLKRRLLKEISIPIALVGIGSNLVIPYEEILSLTKDIGANYFEIGNIEDDRFQETLDLIATQVLVKLQE